jgi:hypothetical protein
MKAYMSKWSKRDTKMLLDVCITSITTIGLVYCMLPIFWVSPGFVLCIMLACIYPIYIQRQYDAPYARRYVYDAVRYNIMLIWAFSIPYLSSSLAYAIFFTKLMKEWLSCFSNEYTELYCCMVWFSLLYFVNYYHAITTVSAVCSYILAADISYHQMRGRSNESTFSLAKYSNMFAQFVSEKISTTI